MTPVIKYIPVFSGKTDDGEKLVVYKNVLKISMELLIKVGDGELQVLSKGAELEDWYDRLDDYHHISIVSPEWTGKASGAYADLIKEEGLRDEDV